MVLSEKSRAEMFSYFSSTPLGEEVTSEMIANFPDYNLEDLVTKDFLRAELSEQIGSVRSDMADLRYELTTTITNQIGSVRSDMADQFGSAIEDVGTLRTDMAQQLGSVRSDMAQQLGSVRSDMAQQLGSVRSDMAQQLGSVRSDMAQQLGLVRSDMADQIGSVRSDMADQTQKLLLWMIATMITLAGVVSGVALAVH